jgi:hypothetical protein
VETKGPQPIPREVLDRWQIPATQPGRKYPELLSATALKRAAQLINRKDPIKQEDPLTWSLFKIVEEVYTGRDSQCKHRPSIEAGFQPAVGDSCAELFLFAYYTEAQRFDPSDPAVRNHPKTIMFKARHDIRPIADAIVTLLTTGSEGGKVDVATLNKWVMEEAKADDERIQAERMPIDLSGDSDDGGAAMVI